MLDQLSRVLQGTWVCVLREPDDVVLVLGLVLPLVLIGLNTVRGTARQSEWK